MTFEAPIIVRNRTQMLYKLRLCPVFLNWTPPFGLLTNLWSQFFNSIKIIIPLISSFTVFLISGRVPLNYKQNENIRRNRKTDFLGYGSDKVRINQKVAILKLYW